jgi:hypothetical protein
MDYLAEFQGRRSELRGVSEGAVLLQRGGSVQLAYLLVFRDVGGLVRVDVAGVDEDPLQLVVGARRLALRLLDPM